ncbi:MAG: hypothetical protein ACK4MM_05845, partial [Fervidobacterium sp.]
MENYTRDTIVALSSPHGVGAIGVIRISGNKALELLEKTVKFKRIPTERKLYFGNFFDDNGEIVDEIMYAYFRAPKSYTGEDVVEIYSHGGVLVTKKILETYINLGARLAENGEFTRRAFLNGKMDLIKAESVLQIIEAKSETSLKLALENLKGKLSSEVNFLRSSLLDVLSKIEVSIDYGDDIEVDVSEILKDLMEIKNFNPHFLKGFTLTEILIIVAIFFLLNVGGVVAYKSFQKKAELMNTTRMVVAIIRLAQNKSLASEGSSQWGVYFSTSSFP